MRMSSIKELSSMKIGMGIKGMLMMWCGFAIRADTGGVKTADEAGIGHGVA
jgi:hypothetical protein